MGSHYQRLGLRSFTGPIDSMQRLARLETLSCWHVLAIDQLNLELLQASLSLVHFLKLMIFIFHLKGSLAVDREEVSHRNYLCSLYKNVLLLVQKIDPA